MRSHGSSKSGAGCSHLLCKRVRVTRASLSKGGFVDLVAVGHGRLDKCRVL